MTRLNKMSGKKTDAEPTNILIHTYQRNSQAIYFATHRSDHYAT